MVRASVRNFMVVILLLVVIDRGTFLFVQPQNNEVGMALQKAEDFQGDPAIIFLGDSFADGAYANCGDSRIVNSSLALNMSSEIPAQYFLLKRLFSGGVKPKAVIFLGINPLGKSLSTPATENYFTRWFLKLDEIFEMALAKRTLVLPMQQILHKISLLFRNRFSIQEKFLFLSNESDFRAKAVWDRPHLQLRPGSSLSDIYWEKMIRLAASVGAKLYYIPPPVGEHFKRWFESTDYLNSIPLNEMDEYMAELEIKYSNFHFLKGERFVMEEKYFRDIPHCNEEGWAVYRERFKEILKKIEAENGLSLYFNKPD